MHLVVDHEGAPFPVVWEPERGLFLLGKDGAYTLPTPGPHRIAPDSPEPLGVLTPNGELVFAYISAGRSGTEPRYQVTVSYDPLIKLGGYEVAPLQD